MSNKRPSVKQLIAEFDSSGMRDRAAELLAAFRTISAISDDEITLLTMADAKSRPESCHTIKFIDSEGRFLYDVRTRCGVMAAAMIWAFFPELMPSRKSE